MYWPNGVPRAYAVNGAGTRPSTADGEEDNNGEASSGKKGSSYDHNQRPSRREYSERWANEPINGLCVSRSGHLFATMTESSISVWQTRPTAVVAAVSRSQSSLKTYGPNTSLLLRPDSAILAVQTLHGYLITYSIATDHNSRVYQQRFGETQNRRQQARHQVSDDANGVREVSIRFRMAIKVDAGISTAFALENELVVATVKPAAIQCIRWTPDRSGTQTNTELLSRIPWMSTKSTVAGMVYDRAMNLLVWMTSDGHAYAVQRCGDAALAQDEPKKLFRGHRFHTPENDSQKAVQAAVNAKFSLLAVSSTNGEICIYTAKDYLGNIPLSHKLSPPASFATTGPVTFMSYSPDGYCLFVGYERGWSMWSVFGKPGGNSFTCDRSIAEANGEKWLEGISMGCWIGGGSDIILASRNDTRLWVLETARSALTGCFSSTNLVRALLQTSTEIILYRGHDLPDITTISGKDSLWHHAQYPPTYLHSQWPIRSCIVSQDGRYVAIAGRRGLAHYSVNSGRWKTFDDPKIEDSFAVRGGMCWYGHILIAAIESDNSYELRMYSRELALNNSSILHVEVLPAPVVFIGPSGEDSLLVYTYDNVLYHYIINSDQNRISLIQVGQIAFHGIVRAPTRVRSISWILPDNQLRNGDPSQDVAVASVLFLVDGKLVLMQPSVSSTGDLKYDMRVVAHDVEYYILMRDQLAFNFAPPAESVPPSPAAESALGGSQGNLSLRDSLWTFCGKDLLTWSDVQDILRPPTEGVPEDVSKPLAVPVDFYPLSILLSKGIILGVESEMMQRRDITFAILRFAIRTHLFLPYFLRHNLEHLDMPSALSLCHNYSGLSYFPHALEILLHHVLDDEVDNQALDEKLPGVSPPRPLLPSALSFLQASLPAPLYLDILVQCTRKTELRSWRTLFAHLPSPRELFEQALKLNSLKTAGGYLLVLQEIDDEEGGQLEDYVVRLLKLASQNGDWELCKELARFLVALDGSGEILRRSINKAGLNIGNGIKSSQLKNINTRNGTSTSEPHNTGGLGLSFSDRRPTSSSTLIPGVNRHRREDSDVSTSSDGTATTAPQDGN